MDYLKTHEKEAKHQKFHTTNGAVWEPGNRWKPNNEYSISEFLGTHNWSSRLIVNLLQIHNKLAPEIVKQLQNYSTSDRGKSIGMAKNTGVELAKLGKESPYQKPLADIVREKHDRA